MTFLFLILPLLLSILRGQDRRRERLPCYSTSTQNRHIKTKCEPKPESEERGKYRHWLPDAIVRVCFGSAGFHFRFSDFGVRLSIFDFRFFDFQISILEFRFS